MSDNLVINEDFAWKKFVSTGNVNDYIRYFESKSSDFNNIITPNGGGNVFENKCPGDSDKRN